MNAPLTIYQDNLLTTKKLRGRGTFDATLSDITGDGSMDFIVASQHDGDNSDVTALIYYSSPEGYTEKYMTELYAPSAISVAAGDFRGIGKNDVAFACVDYIRVFEQTNLGIESTIFKDINIQAISLVSGDIDGDGYLSITFSRNTL